MIVFQGYQLQPFEEAIGTLGDVQQLDGYTLAKIGPVSVALPMEMAERLSSLKGQRVGVIRTDNDFRLRIIKSDKGSTR